MAAPDESHNRVFAVDLHDLGAVHAAAVDEVQHERRHVVGAQVRGPVHGEGDSATVTLDPPAASCFLPMPCRKAAFYGMLPGINRVLLATTPVQAMFGYSW